MTTGLNGINHLVVHPLPGATPPDDTVGEYGFDFTSFGPRVPAVLVSSLIALGTVFRVADGTTPLDHTPADLDQVRAELEARSHPAVSVHTRP